jgi:hypothetical protein
MKSEHEVIQAHIRRARLERSLFIAECIAVGIVAVAGALGIARRPFASLARAGKRRAARASA